MAEEPKITLPPAKKPLPAVETKRILAPLDMDKVFSQKNVILMDAVASTHPQKKKTDISTVEAAVMFSELPVGQSLDRVRDWERNGRKDGNTIVTFKEFKPKDDTERAEMQAAYDALGINSDGKVKLLRQEEAFKAEDGTTSSRSIYIAVDSSAIDANGTVDPKTKPLGTYVYREEQDNMGQRVFASVATAGHGKPVILRTFDIKKKSDEKDAYIVIEGSNLFTANAKREKGDPFKVRAVDKDGNTTERTYTAEDMLKTYEDRLKREREQDKHKKSDATFVDPERLEKGVARAALAFGGSDENSQPKADGHGLSGVAVALTSPATPKRG